MKRSLEVRIENTYAALPHLTGPAEQFLKDNVLPPDVAYKTHLALEEICTNIIKYGYDSPGPHEILVRLECRSGVLTLTIEDDGHPFDPLTAPEPDTTVPLAQRKIGGLGIYLVRRSVDVMRYRREGLRNILNIELNIPVAAPVPVD